MPAFAFERAGVRLAGTDSGSDLPAVLLLHGLAGDSGEWAATTGHLTGSARAVSPDARGHGAAEHRPADVSRTAHVADVVAVIDHLGLDRPVVVGQSLGGVTALQLAARHPDLVRGLVLVEAGPAGGGTEEEQATTAADVAGYVEGLRPRFDPEVLLRVLREAESRSYWDEWERIVCPVLVVVGARGTLRRAEIDEMVSRRPDTRVVEIDDAGHDLHLDRPDEWHDVLVAFLGELGF